MKTDKVIPEITPLRVPAFGREWTVTPWLEPIWKADGHLEALELLSRPVETASSVPMSPVIFFDQLPLTEHLRVLRWQLDILVLIAPWCSARKVSVSVNINRTLAMLILSDSSIQETILMLAPYIRLEISERFLPAGADTNGDPFLNGLAMMAPLWLDDFGAGSTALSWMMSGLFEAVKIDRTLMLGLQPIQEGLTFISALCRLASATTTSVIAEGIAGYDNLEFVRRAKVPYCQGMMWPGLKPNALLTLAEYLPVTE